MITQVEIENYKSVENLTLELGRINVLIGENGCGKSNILEAIAIATAAGRDKVDNEFLASRGIRVTEPGFMRSAFGDQQSTRDIKLGLRLHDGIPLRFQLHDESTSTHSRWSRISPSIELDVGVEKVVDRLILQSAESSGAGGDWFAELLKRLGAGDPSFYATVRGAFISAVLASKNLTPDFVIYSPENTSLRTFQTEGQILPLGVNGEGLFAHLRDLSKSEDTERFESITSGLSLIDWFERLEIPIDLSPGERVIRIRDRHLPESALFDQRSANEGFLFLLFYFTLFASNDTPSFFAVDNIDASLNPKLCSELVKELAGLAKKYDKQAILTTHNPAVLDGLDLNDDEQRLFVVYRNKHGHTQVRRVMKPEPQPGEVPVKLSEAFLRGYIGGLPKNF